MNTTTNNPFYTETTKSDATDIQIKWNVIAIAGNSIATGYILQHMHIRSHISCVSEDDYWEAWPVLEGCINRKNYKYDDNWSPIPACLVAYFAEEINASSDGIIQYHSEVFWIPERTEAYEEVSQWKPVDGSGAGDLPTARVLDQDVREYFVCRRQHIWDYKQILEEVTG